MQYSYVIILAISTAFGDPIGVNKTGMEIVSRYYLTDSKCMHTYLSFVFWGGEEVR